MLCPVLASVPNSCDLNPRNKPEAEDPLALRCFSWRRISSIIIPQFGCRGTCARDTGSDADRALGATGGDSRACEATAKKNQKFTADNKK
jgi:hypothetical protein